MFWALVCIAFVAGGFLGFLFAALMAAADNGDRIQGRGPR